MIPLLEHELIKKYFGCDSSCTAYDYRCSERMAFRVLQAQSEPIKKDELCVNYEGGRIQDKLFVWPYDKPCEGFHPTLFRLPSQFQPRREPECGKCDTCGYDYQRYCRQHMQGAHELCGSRDSDGCPTPKPDPVDRCLCEKPKNETGPCWTSEKAVEEKIKEIERKIISWAEGFLRDHLRELVELARGSK